MHVVENSGRDKTSRNRSTLSVLSLHLWPTQLPASPCVFVRRSGAVRQRSNGKCDKRTLRGYEQTEAVPVPILHILTRHLLVRPFNLSFAASDTVHTSAPLGPRKVSRSNNVSVLGCNLPKRSYKQPFIPPTCSPWGLIIAHLGLARVVGYLLYANLVSRKPSCALSTQESMKKYIEKCGKSVLVLMLAICK